MKVYYDASHWSDARWCVEIHPHLIYHFSTEDRARAMVRLERDFQAKLADLID